MNLEVGKFYKKENARYIDYFKPILELKGKIFECEYLSLGKAGTGSEGVIYGKPIFFINEHDPLELSSLEEYNAARELARSLI
jgi:hypothetical protein